MSKKLPVIGDCVVFVNPQGMECYALVTAVWGFSPAMPAINVVIVSWDEKRTDQYGRQLERISSVVHGDHQAAGGNYWHHVPR